MFNIKGHSGCKLAVFSEKERTLVRKSSPGKHYDQRLRLQAEKQQRFSNRLSSFSELVIPEVVSIDKKCFIMDFFHGEDAITFFDSCNIRQIDALIDSLICFLNHSISNSQLEIFDKPGFLDKLNSIEKKITSDEVDFTLIRRYFSNLPEIMIPVGICHGDLTFSNMLFDKSNRVCLIDFLDTFYETPLQDMVKIRQDTLYNWTALMCRQSYDVTRYGMLMRYLDRKFVDHFEKYDFYETYYEAFQVMNYLRILPYAKRKSIKSNVTQKLKEMTSQWT